MKLSSCLLVIALLQIPSIGYSAGATGTVTSITNGWGGEGYYFYLNPESSLNGCGTRYYFLNKNGLASYKDAQANVMLAYATKANVQITVDSPITCTNTAATVVGVQLN